MNENNHIFIFEDEKPVFDSLKKLLVMSGFSVEGADCGKDALARVKHCKPNVILLDIKMPDVDGFELCRLFKEDSETKDLPIIVLSGLSDEQDIVKARAMGALDYFSKPYDYLKLVDKIKEVVT